MNILELINKFPTQEARIRNLENVRWNDKL
jgi:hypothetical protein